MVTLPWWRPDRFEPRLPTLRLRAEVLRAIRQYFLDAEFLEVETPILQVCPGLEPHLQLFKTELSGPQPGSERTAYLHTSPEYAMKKLLVAGLPKIFQFARVFRNEQRSATHHPEFTMLEWYRTEAGYLDLVADIEGILNALPIDGPMRFRDAECDPKAGVEVLTVAEAFERYVQLDLLSLIDDPQSPDPAPFKAAAEERGFRCAPDDRWDDIFFRIFLESIEPKLGIGRATVLTDYPASMAALSRIKPEDPRLCERFELYVCGLELANAFGELTDAAEQRRRFEEDIALRKSLYGDSVPIDEDFLSALEHGMPEAAGIALGVDRLVMLAACVEDIEQTFWAPVFDS